MEEVALETAEVQETEKEIQPHILFVDDDPTILASLRCLFRRENYILEYALSGGQALSILESHHVEVIVSDMKMPKMSGVEFLAKAADLCPDAIRIILSGYEDKSTILEALAKGTAHQYLHKPWNDKELSLLISNSIKLQSRLVQQNLNAVLHSFANLPSRITNRLRLQQLLSNANSSVDDLSREIEKYPALVAKLLQVANSVYFGVRHPVASVKEAIIFIGTGYIETLLVALELFHEFYKDLDAVTRSHIDALWAKALRRANFARKIAHQWDGIKIPEKAFVAALLQDIGLLVRIYHQPKRYFKMIEYLKEENISLIESDKRMFAISHDIVGSALLKIWNYPDDVIQSVANHHLPISDDVLTTIVMLADVLESPENVKIEDEKFKILVDEWYRKLYPLISLYA